MADKTNKRGSSGRPPKVSRTIDLQANPDTGSDVISDTGPETGSDDAVKDNLTDTAPEMASVASDEPRIDEVSEDTPEAEGVDEQNRAEESKSFAMPPAKAPNERTRTSSSSLVLSAVLGGAVALAGSTLFGENSVLRNVPLIGGLVSGADPANDAVSAELADLKMQIEAIGKSNTVPTEITDRLSGIEGVISTLKENIGATASGGGTGDALNIAKAAEERSLALEKQVSQLEDRIVSAAGAGIDVEAVKTALSGETTQLAERIAALETAAKNISPVMGDQLTGVNEQVGELKGALSAIESRISTLELTVNEKIMPSMESVEKAGEAALQSQSVARSVSARALEVALENGNSIDAELASAEALIGKSANIDALKALSAKGIKSGQTLVSEFDVIAGKIQSLDGGTQTDSGIMDRFLASAKSLVTVRPAGPIDGDSDIAVVSRISASLNSGVFADGLSEWQKLSDPAKEASKEWAQALADRTQANRLIRKIIGELSVNPANDNTANKG